MPHIGIKSCTSSLFIILWWLMLQSDVTVIHKITETKESIVYNACVRRTINSQPITITNVGWPRSSKYRIKEQCLWWFIEGLRETQKKTYNKFQRDMKIKRPFDLYACQFLATICKRKFSPNSTVSRRISV